MLASLRTPTIAEELGFGAHLPCGKAGNGVDIGSAEPVAATVATEVGSTKAPEAATNVWGGGGVGVLTQIFTHTHTHPHTHYTKPVYTKPVYTKPVYIRTDLHENSLH
jgi:hypothetical protein